jgi:hypothetical protein
LCGWNSPEVCPHARLEFLPLCGRRQQQRQSVRFLDLRSLLPTGILPYSLPVVYLLLFRTVYQKSRVLSLGKWLSAPFFKGLSVVVREPESKPKASKGRACWSRNDHDRGRSEIATNSAVIHCFATLPRQGGLRSRPLGSPLPSHWGFPSAAEGVPPFYIPAQPCADWMRAIALPLWTGNRVLPPPTPRREARAALLPD